MNLIFCKIINNKLYNITSDLLLKLKSCRSVSSRNRIFKDYKFCSLDDKYKTN